MRKEQFPQCAVLEKLDIHVQKNEIRSPILKTFIKN